MIDVIILKPFAGLSEGQFTQLRESEFEQLHANGYVKKLDAGTKPASIVSKISSDKKATKK